MKKLIMSLIVCLIMSLASGCIGVTPKDIFMEFIQTLKTPKEIAMWVETNVTYKANRLSVLTPFQVYYWKIGDCNDTSGFITYIAETHEYETWEILIYYSNTSDKHMIGVYQEDRLSYTGNGYYYYGFDTFREIVIDDDKHDGYNWEGYKVYDGEYNIVERGIRY